MRVEKHADAACSAERRRVVVSVAPVRQHGTEERTSVDAPSWLEGAHRYRTVHDRIAHRDRTCDFMYPGTWLDRDGRCILPKGHEGQHLYRRELDDVPTREQAYQAERERRIHARLKRERAARVKRAVGYPG